jgi:hypothetical protein
MNANPLENERVLTPYPAGKGLSSLGSLPRQKLLRIQNFLAPERPGIRLPLVEDGFVGPVKRRRILLADFHTSLAI